MQLHKGRLADGYAVLNCCATPPDRQRKVSLSACCSCLIVYA